MEKMRITDYHYYPESDELDLAINVDKPRPAVSVPLSDEFFFLRVDPETNEVVGATILNVSRWFAELAHAFAVRAFDDTDVHLLLEKKIEMLALQRA